MTRKQGRPMPFAMLLASVPAPASATNWAAVVETRAGGVGGGAIEQCAVGWVSTRAMASTPAAAHQLQSRKNTNKQTRTGKDRGCDLEGQAQRRHALGHHAPAPGVLVKHCRAGQGGRQEEERPAQLSSAEVKLRTVGRASTHCRPPPALARSPCARLPPTMRRPAAPSPSLVIHLMAADVATAAAGLTPMPSA